MPIVQQQECVTVGYSCRYRARSHGLSATWAVVDNHRLPEAILQLICDYPGQCIHRGARRNRQDDFNRFRRVRLRSGKPRKQSKACKRGDRVEKLTTSKRHGVAIHLAVTLKLWMLNVEDGSAK